MFSFLSNWKLITILILAGSLAGSAYLLKQSYKTNGEQEAITNQLRTVNDETARVLVSERERFNELQQKMIDRDLSRNRINKELASARSKLNEIPDDSGCLDTDLGPAFWLRITGDTTTAETVPTD